MKKKSSRREFIKQTAIIGAGGILLPQLLTAENNFIHNVQFSLAPLSYSYDSLEPHIDKLTMEIHHSKHHQAYVNNLNKALTEINAGHITIEQLCASASKYNTTIRNNAGGHYNHTLFWQLMKPNGGGAPVGKISEAIISSFGSFEKFKTTFSDAALKIFGSGWAWLVVNTDKKLQIGTTPNQDNPLMDLTAGEAGVPSFKGTPVLALDVWEHAYYMKHQNKRADYITSWWNVVNWEKVNELYLTAL